MNNLKISDTKDFFLLDNKPFFYLADTVWSAFTNITLEDWKNYLDYRKLQGFNALQINVLAQWDASLPYLYFPFKRDKKGNFSSFDLNNEYFDRAEKMLKIAREKGFTPALVLLWCNFVPDTWASKRKISPVIPFEKIKDYVEYVVQKFFKFNPIWIISGDTDFGSKKTIDYYLTALQIVKTMCPEALTTMHLNPSSDLPESLSNSSFLDFYMYQSGHCKDEQNLPYLLAQKFYQKPVKKPIINGEPCYEGHSYGHTKDGRFSTFDVRKAVWQSLLSGAKAGVTYGAHGIWSWHEREKKFQGMEFSGEPFEWQEALYLEGAWDVSFAKHVFEKFNLFNLEPAQNLLVNSTEEIRVATSRDGEKLVIYSPFASQISLRLNLKEYDEVVGIDLSKRRWVVPEISFRNNLSVIEMVPLNSDFLILAWKD